MRKCKYCPRTFCGQRALKAHELECGGNEESFEENVVSSPITLEELNKRKK